MIRETHIIPENVSPERLSNYARNKFQALPTRKSLQKALKRGAIRIDGKEAQTATWIKPGQRLELLEEPPLTTKPFKLKLEVIFEDEQLALINKPAGFEVSGNKFKTIQNALTSNLALSAKPDALITPRPIHRLDYATSGILLIAKTVHAQQHLSRQFQDKQTKKEYHAIIMGTPPQNGSIDIPINNQTAHSSFECLKTVQSLKSNTLSLVKLYPQTGRTHQLRIHMANIGHPILGDRKYVKEGKTLKGKGLFLCATQLTIMHPSSQKVSTFQVDLPHKFNAQLRREQERWNKYSSQK